MDSHIRGTSPSRGRSVELPCIELVFGFVERGPVL
jgi:hypothetical protein